VCVKEYRGVRGSRQRRVVSLSRTSRKKARPGVFSARKEKAAVCATPNVACGRSTRCSRSDPADRAYAFAAPRSRRRARPGAGPDCSRASGVVRRRRPNRGTSSARAFDAIARAIQPPRFRCRYRPRPREKNPKFVRDALRERRAATAARGEHALARANATPRSCLGAFAVSRGVRRARTARGRRVPGTTRCVTSGSVRAWQESSMGAPRETHLGDGGAARDAHGGAEGGETDGGDGRHLRVLGLGCRCR